MAKRRWSIKSYNRFIREAKKKGLATEQARIAYRQMKGRLGREVYAADIYDHKRIWGDSFRELAGEREQAANILDWMEAQDVELSPQVESLLYRHADEKGYRFELEGEGILKVSISTVKTKKKFSVRL